MDPIRKEAYRLLLSVAFLHSKWDLARFQRGLSWPPWQFWSQAHNARRAALRTATFHNLAIFAAHDFEGFIETKFWEDVRRFLRSFPDTSWNNYRGIFEAVLCGETVHVIQPGGGVPLVVD